MIKSQNGLKSILRYTRVIIIINAGLIFSLIGWSCHNNKSNTYNDSNLIEIIDGNFKLQVKKTQFQISFSHTDGTIVAPAHFDTGLVFSGGEVVNVEDISENVRRNSEKKLLATNVEGDKANIYISFKNQVATFRIEPEKKGTNTISLRLGGMPVAHGLGDVAAYEEDFNIIKNKRKTYVIENNGGGKRWVSTFTIFPQNSLAGVFFDKGKKSVVLNDQEYQMNITTEGEATFYYFLGEPTEIYKNYKSVRNQNGYVDVLPKSRLFELGWESWDALGWNTNQVTVKGILEKFLQNGYPIKWAVTGSGFWDKGGTTTSFGRWGEKFSDASTFKTWMNDHDIKWMIGLRTNFIPEGGPYFPKTKKRDKNLKVNSFYGNELTTEAKRNGYLVNNSEGKPFAITSNIFPIVPSHLLNGEVPGAAEWYQKQYAKWEVDGIKEDTMMDLDSLTNVYNAPITEISNEGGLVMARNGEFTAPGSLLRINDTGVGQLSGRIPINYLQYAASGFPNVYSDVTGVHNMHNIKDVDRNIRHTWLLSLTSGIAVGAFPEKWPEDKRKIFKKAIDFHYALAPYMYSAAVASYESGYPYTLTPMTIAFPKDSMTSKLEHFQWMIGKSVIATPLLKNYQSGKMNVYLPDGVWFDFDSGKKYEGPVVLEAFEIPLDKTPCFVGGQGVIVLRDSDNTHLSAKVYPIADRKTSFSFTYPDGVAKSIITYKKWSSNEKLVVVDTTLNKRVPFETDAVSGNISFEITPNHNYNIIEE
ncbi:glycoside hydrolase family 31 protein [Fulvivirgaceae bacterium BMA10]|uniref:Glycoside hydrolase family 31 protein n=1 Tax=Splendidivirga corallicola TaxID=3051826 RepID=A0ABT8KHX5_9BACT|nr:glycoside hydrolase family 31 protein [Fulvivirgaceae bacterium BMA10]